MENCCKRCFSECEWPEEDWLGSGSPAIMVKKEEEVKDDEGESARGDGWDDR